MPGLRAKLDAYRRQKEVAHVAAPAAWQNAESGSETAGIDTAATTLLQQSTAGLQAAGQEAEQQPLVVQPWSLVLLKLLLWALLQVLFIVLGFGLPFFVVSSLYGMWANTEVGRKRRAGQKSAYSVFNENCEAIDGSLDAEEMTRQMLYGPAALAMSAAKKRQ